MNEEFKKMVENLTYEEKIIILEKIEKIEKITGRKPITDKESSKEYFDDIRKLLEALVERALESNINSHVAMFGCLLAAFHTSPESVERMSRIVCMQGQTELMMMDEN